MKLYSLSVRPDLPDTEGENPWWRDYDRAHAFIVQATDAKHAREIAAADAGDEKHFPHGNPWLLSKYTVCRPLKAGRKAGVIMQDYRSA